MEAAARIDEGSGELLAPWEAKVCEQVEMKKNLKKADFVSLANGCVANLLSPMMQMRTC